MTYIINKTVLGTGIIPLLLEVLISFKSVSSSRLPINVGKDKR